MKRAHLIQMLNRMGAVLVRNGKRHDVYRQSVTGAETTVPRHNEIKEFTARSILKTLSPDVEQSLG